VTGAGELRRDVVILACAISAGIHAALVPAHLDERAAAGGGFLAAALALSALAVLIMRRPASAVGPASAVVVFGGLIVSYVFATTTGVPVLQPEPEPVDGLALATKAIELVGVVTAWSLVSGRTAAGLRPSRPIPLFLAGIVATFSALAAIAVSGGHHGHAHHDHHDHHDHAHHHTPTEVVSAPSDQ
jgi:hypothetical protein